MLVLPMALVPVLRDLLCSMWRERGRYGRKKETGSKKVEIGGDEGIASGVG